MPRADLIISAWSAPISKAVILSFLIVSSAFFASFIIVSKTIILVCNSAVESINFLAKRPRPTPLPSSAIVLPNLPKDLSRWPTPRIDWFNAPKLLFPKEEIACLARIKFWSPWSCILTGIWIPLAISIFLNYLLDSIIILRAAQGGSFWFL